MIAVSVGLLPETKPLVSRRIMSDDEYIPPTKEELDSLKGQLAAQNENLAAASKRISELEEAALVEQDKLVRMEILYQSIQMNFDAIVTERRHLQRSLMDLTLRCDGMQKEAAMQQERLTKLLIRAKHYESDPEINNDIVTELRQRGL